MQETNMQDLSSDSKEGRRVLIQKLSNLMKNNSLKKEVFEGLSRAINHLDKREYLRTVEIISRVAEYDLDYEDKKILSSVLETIEKMRQDRKERDLKKAW